MPIARPTQLPIAMDGKKIPAGTRKPKVTAVMTVFAEAVTLQGTSAYSTDAHLKGLQQKEDDISLMILVAEAIWITRAVRE